MAPNPDPDQFHNLHLMPPPPSFSGNQPPPLPVPATSWDLSPTLHPEGPKALPIHPLRPRIRTSLKQETSPQDPAPAPLLPSGEEAGAEGIVLVHVPFSRIDLSQAKQCLGSFSSDPDNYLKEFKYLTQSYGLAWHGIYIILSPTLLPEEKEWVWQTSQAPAAEILRTEDTKAQEATAVRPRETPSGVIRQGDLDEKLVITWLLASLWAIKRQGVKPSTLISARK